MTKPIFLDQKELENIISSFPNDIALSVVKIRYKNHEPIKHIESMPISAFRRFVIEALETGYCQDIELFVPLLDKNLIGHHDGLFWLE